MARAPSIERSAAARLRGYAFVHRRLLLDVARDAEFRDRDGLDRLLRGETSLQIRRIDVASAIQTALLRQQLRERGRTRAAGRSATCSSASIRRRATTPSGRRPRTASARPRR